ncbi:hypothetical protein KUL25_17155 [Rhodobacteraceae bacterium N5(2021)]|uniref:Uncharacterized protein n=1 Tax=Gymnodinialimonas phycosphaerae TaxID=2841589 RepID=A0A975YFA7_9RHOB|nr:hypothetical protein [Gymnodinialimonas phycosphaerae]MBY4894488.1 hypothetical protein [Gymnodinialimonas phycosphaerae]
MTGPKLISMILFGTLAWMFGFLFTVGLSGASGGLLAGVIVAGLSCTFIWFASCGRHAFARGFLSLGAVFIIVPVAGMVGFGEQVAETSVAALQSGEGLTDEEASALFLSSIMAGAGLIFGIIVGLVLVLIGGLMHRRTVPTPDLAP